MDIVDKILSGDIRSTARLLRDIDDRIPSVRPILKELYPHTGRAHVVGLTGMPGAGKSTLVDQLTRLYRKAGKTVGILAVDPTSPFTGGAILGDRIRMQRHFLDEGVFIRSLATRGHFGGITKSTNDMIAVLDAMGKDVVLIETVGVGQDEIEIVESAHTTVLITVPGMGDEVQAIKAGIMEIGDILVVNKADREGSRRLVRELRSLMEMASPPPSSRAAGGWATPIIETEAHKGKGIQDIFDHLELHRSHLLSNDGERMDAILERRARNQLVDLLRDEVLKAVLGRMEARGISFDSLVRRIARKEIDPYTAVEKSIPGELL